MSGEQAATCRVLAGSAPEEVVEIVRRSLGSPAAYHAVLREVLRVRTDPVTGRSWTSVQELVCRCAFRAVVTTNYDPGIVDARMRVRPGASATGFMTWQDELGLDEWRTGRVFGGVELPVLYAHGVHSQPDSVVLAAVDYRRAYAGKLAGVLERLADGGHMCWIGFSFADQRLARIHLAAAVAAFGQGDYLTNLAEALPGLAACALASGDLAAAGRHPAEAIAVVAPRGLIPAHATALAARARLRAAQATVTGNMDALLQGRDDADAARRLAVRHHLPWHELDALHAHAALDQAEHIGRGWAAQADALHAQLVPPGLDPDPLATVERLVAAQKAAEEQAAGRDEDGSEG